jgi:hypothetical protein
MLTLKVHRVGTVISNFHFHLFTDFVLTKELIGMCHSGVTLYVDVKSTFEWVS